MKEYKISEFAKKIGVSRQTLLNWDKSGKLKPSHFSKKGYRLYSQKQLDEFLKNENKSEPKETKNEKDDFQNNSINQSSENSEVVEILREQIEFLKEQIKIKDELFEEQLKAKDEIIKREQELRLFADRKILLLEENSKAENLESEQEEKVKKTWWKFW